MSGPAGGEKPAARLAAGQPEGADRAGGSRRAELAMEYHHQGYNCAQSVLLAFGDLTGLDQEACKAVALGFGAGMGRLQKTCGAVTGAIMVIGALSFDDADLMGTKEVAYARTRDFVAAFEAARGNAECLRLLGFNLQDKDMAGWARDHGYLERICGPCIMDSCRLLEQQLRLKT